MKASPESQKTSEKATYTQESERAKELLLKHLPHMTETLRRFLEEHWEKRNTISYAALREALLDSGIVTHDIGGGLVSFDATRTSGGSQLYDKLFFTSTEDMLQYVADWYDRDASAPVKEQEQVSSQEIVENDPDVTPVSFVDSSLTEEHETASPFPISIQLDDLPHIPKKFAQFLRDNWDSREKMEWGEIEPILTEIGYSVTKVPSRDGDENYSQLDLNDYRSISIESPSGTRTSILSKEASFQLFADWLLRDERATRDARTKKETDDAFLKEVNDQLIHRSKQVRADNGRHPLEGRSTSPKAASPNNVDRVLGELYGSSHTPNEGIPRNGEREGVANAPRVDTRAERPVSNNLPPTPPKMRSPGVVPPWGGAAIPKKPSVVRSMWNKLVSWFS